MPNSESLLEANIKKTNLEQFQVDNKPFNYISDHFGIVASVDYLGIVA